MTDFDKFIEDHVYVPIIAGVVVLVLLVVIFYCCCKKYRARKYRYSPLKDEVSLYQKLEGERQLQHNALREGAWMNCQYYLRSHPQYTNLQQMEDIGSRGNKHWFKAYDTRTRAYRLLTITQQNPKMAIPFTQPNRKILKDMLSLIQHPYIFPFGDIDFVTDQRLVVVVQPISVRGSLKDYIYQSKSMDPWKDKYNQKSRGLSMKQVQQFGRQVLEALLYLEEKGFPPHGHLHSGNIMFENGCCRLTALENTFLGYECRIFAVIKKKSKENKDILDVILFGHLVYEMCVGCELNSAHPDPGQLTACKNHQVIEVLNFIFPEGNSPYPTLKEIKDHHFFSSTKMLELDDFNFTPIRLSKEMKNFTKAVRTGKTLKKTRGTVRASSSTDLANFNKASEPPTPTTPSPTKAPFTPAPPPPPPAPAPPPPPPPGAPPPPPPPQSNAPLPQPSSSRAALLGSIRKGAKLKKTETKDRSAPRL